MGSAARFQKFIEILRCPHCGKGKIAAFEMKLKCGNCGFEFPVKNSVPDMRPSDTKIPKLGIYSDRDYMEWMKNRERFRRYFYETKGIVSFVQKSGHRLIMSLKGAKKYNILLDLGCGNGDHYPYERFKENCFGVDNDANALEILRERYPGLFAVCADCCDMPIEDNSVDCVVSVSTLEHIAYLDMMLEDVDRVMAPDGDIFISVPNEGGLMWGMGRALTSARRFAVEKFNYERVVSIEHINCVWQIEKALKRYFQIKRKARFPFFIGSFNLNLVTAYHCKKK